MKITRIKHNEREQYAVIDGEFLLPIKGTPFKFIEYSGECIKINEAVFLPPVLPTKIVAVGKNYSAHAIEMGEGEPAEPLLFLKPTTCIIGNDEEIIYPSISKRLDYEGELGVVIGKRASHVEKGRSGEYIFGYTCLNDVTARDIQKSDPQWTRGKSFDTFCPIGPYIETDLDGMNANISTYLNGKIVQSSNTSHMTHNIDKLVCYITQCMTLLPGDIIATGTPEGIGSMQPGDVVEVEIEGIGILRNKVVS